MTALKSNSTQWKLLTEGFTSHSKSISLVHVRGCVHVHARVCLCACVEVHMCVCVCVFMCEIVQACVQFYVCTNVRTCMRESELANSPAYKGMYVRV